VILNPSASHFAFGKIAKCANRIRRSRVRARSAVAYVYANLLGNEAGRAIYDGHTLISAPSLVRAPAAGSVGRPAAGERSSPWSSEEEESPTNDERGVGGGLGPPPSSAGGADIIEGPRFSFREHVLVHAAIDLEEIRARRAATASFTPRLPRDRELYVHAPVRIPEAPREAATSRVAAWESGPHVKHEEFGRAVSLGLFDYLRKSRAQGFVVSLSGGADSAAISCLVAWMVRASSEELGMPALRDRLAHVRDLASCESERDVVGRLLTTVYQSTVNSGSVTRNAARAVAEGIGARHHEVDVDALVKGYVALAEGALNRPLAWQTDDIARQNVQARARAPERVDARQPGRRPAADDVQPQRGRRRLRDDGRRHVRRSRAPSPASTRTTSASGCAGSSTPVCRGFALRPCAVGESTCSNPRRSCARRT
jgi:NAD+ synthase (glutamine-hydrolysing)